MYKHLANWKTTYNTIQCTSIPLSGYKLLWVPWKQNIHIPISLQCLGHNILSEYIYMWIKEFLLIFKWSTCTKGQHTVHKLSFFFEKHRSELVCCNHHGNSHAYKICIVLFQRRPAIVHGVKRPSPLKLPPDCNLYTHSYEAHNEPSSSDILLLDITCIVWYILMTTSTVFPACCNISSTKCK